MEGRRLERLVRAPDLEVRRAGHAVLPQWRSTPCPAIAPLPAGSAAASVVCGAEHTLVLTKEGGVLGFGRGESGQLGYGKLKESNDAPVAAKVLEPPSRLALEAAAEDPADAAAAAKAAGTPARVTLLTACGNRSVCLSEEDSFFTWGAGWKARRKPAPKPAAKARKVGKLSKLCLTQVQLGDELGVAMDMVGRVYTFGGAEHAALGRRETPPEKGFGVELVGGFGPKGLTTVAGVACGSSHCLAVTSEGELYSWGCDLAGQCGLGGPKKGFGSVLTMPEFIGSFRGHIVEKVWCGGDSSFALTTTSALFSWGANQHGQLGQGHDRPSEPTPHSVVAVDAAKMTMLSVGRWHTLAVVAGTVWSWGRGCHGQLGWSGQPKMNRPRLVKNVDTAIKSALLVGVSAGENHSAAWTGDGRVVTWGCNMFGQLGYPYVDPRDPYNAGTAQDEEKQRATRKKGKRQPNAPGRGGVNDSVSDLDRRYRRMGGSLGGRLSTPNSLRWFHECASKEDKVSSSGPKYFQQTLMQKSGPHEFVEKFVAERNDELHATEEAVEQRRAAAAMEEQQRAEAAEAKVAAKREAAVESKQRKLQGSPSIHLLKKEGEAGGEAMQSVLSSSKPA